MNSKLLICPKNDSKLLGMAYVHMCQILHFLGPLNSTMHKELDNHHGEDKMHLMFYHRRSHALCKSKVP